MTDWNAVTAFMNSVVAWPGQDPGYINLHYSMIDPNKPKGELLKGMGWPFRDVGTFVSRAAWINNQTNFKDVWFCTSRQSESRLNTKGKPKAYRTSANATHLKAIWIDMDVKPGAYATIEDALKKAIWFREKVGLPPFSAIVSSGNGIHVYWISDTALTKDEWYPYANGLKTLLIAEGITDDAGITTDAARLLRVPGTFNHKSDPAKPVRLSSIPLTAYNFPTQLSFLTNFSPDTGTPVGASPTPDHNIFAEGIDLKGFDTGPSQVFTNKVNGPDLQAGIARFQDTPLDPRPIFEQCGFLRNERDTGGAGTNQALWMHAITCSTFMENGNAIAHEISKEHAGYSPSDTDKMYDRKVADRRDRGIGYPSCATFKDNGSSACATCPLFAKGKSPLNIRPRFTATVSTAGGQSAGGRGLMLPAGYDLNGDGVICKVVGKTSKNESGEDTTELLQLFYSRLTNPWAQSDPDCLNFTSTVDKGTTFMASIKHDEMQGAMEFGRVLAKNKVKTYPDNKKHLEQFFVSWLAKLHEASAAQQSLPFGWFEANGNRHGFVFDGTIFKDDGTEHPCGVGDVKLRKIFHARGELQPWFDACKMITQQQRPELDAILAVSFSAPLTALTGKNAVTLCAYGESGACKSAAYSVGVGVWAHPKLGKGTSHSTFNGVMHKMGELRNLPLYWDEIKDTKAQNSVYDYLYNATDGVEKDRQRSDLSAADKGIWQTQMMMAANISFVDFVMKKDPSHVAGVSRVLEYKVLKVDTGPGRVSQTDADVVIDRVQSNYGQMGRLYAKYLAVNIEQVTKDVIASCKMVEEDLKNTGEERLWVTLVGTMLVGARIANELGCEIGLDRLKTFLYATYLDNRNRRNNMVSVSGKRATTEAIMTEYFGSVMASDQMIWTKGMPMGPGKPPECTLLKQPSAARNPAGTVVVRWDVDKAMLLISKKHLVDWLDEENVGVNTCLASLQAEYAMTFQQKVRLSGGTIYDSGRGTVLAFPIKGANHDWHEMLYKYTPEAERPQAPTPTPPPPETPTAENVIAFVQGATRG